MQRGTVKAVGGKTSIAMVFANLGLLAASVLFALGAVEIYFRVVDPQSIIPRYVETSEYGIRKNIGQVRGTMIVPEYRHQFSTNSQGFRGTKEYAVQKPAGVFRIVVLGDSVALGHGVEDDQTFAALLEAQLSAIRPTEVLNMGVSGFGTAEELIQLRHIGLKYDPDLVILSYFPNDPYNNTVSRLFEIRDDRLVQSKETFVPALYIRDRLYSIPGYSFLCQHSHVVNFIRNRFSGYFIRRLGEQRGIASETSNVLTSDQIKLTSLLLDAVIAETGARQVPLIILNIPLLHEGRAIKNLPIEHLPKTVLVEIVDVEDQIYAGHSVQDISYRQDAHPRPLGHKLIADWLSQSIRSSTSFRGPEGNPREHRQMP